MSRLRLAAVVVTLVALLVPAAARGADSIYWTDYTSGEIKVGNLDGTGTPRKLFGEEIQPGGIALDPADGKVYWSATIPYCSGTCGLVRVGNLDGTGSPKTLFGGLTEPIEGGQGIVVDAAAGKLYWAGGGAISVGNLDGTGTPRILYSNEIEPVDQVGSPDGLAVDPAGGRIFWASRAGAGEIRDASILGEGGTNHTWFPGETSAFGIALDPLTQKLYWTKSTVPGAVRIGNADGTETASDLFAPENNPFGIALDPTAGKVYVASGTEEILVGSMGGGSLQTLFPDGGSPKYPAVLRAPVASGPPTVSGGVRAGQQLSCDRGSWAADMPSADLYRAPGSFAYQWLRDGAPVAGADSSAYTPSLGGSYSCRVTASNQAGDTTQTSDPRSVAPPTFGSDTDVALRLRDLRIRGAGRFRVLVSNGNGFPVSGSLSGHSGRTRHTSHPHAISVGPVPVSVGAGATETIALRLPKPLRILLERKHTLKLFLTLTVTDPAGVSRTVTDEVTLKLARRTGGSRR